MRLLSPLFFFPQNQFKVLLDLMQNIIFYTNYPLVTSCSVVKSNSLLRTLTMNPIWETKAHFDMVYYNYCQT